MSGATFEIIDRELLTKLRRNRGFGVNPWATGSRFILSHKRYRYYVTHASEIIDDTPAWRLPAHDIEKRVVGRLVDFLTDQKAIRKLVGSHDAAKLAGAITRCRRTAEQLQVSTYHRRTKVPALIDRVNLSDDSIRITLSRTGISDFLGIDVDPQHLMPMTAPVSRIRKGKEVKLIISGGPGAERDEALVVLLREAMAVRDEVLSSPNATIAEIAASSSRCRKRMTRLFRLSWIAPKIVETILAGKQPQALTAKALLTADLPMDWSDQKAALGF